MNSPQSPIFSFSSSNSPNYSVSNTAPPNSQTYPVQLPAPPPDLHVNTILSEVVHQSSKIVAQSHDSEQKVSARPTISTCDKSSIRDISERLRSLNSSISDAVDAFMESGSKNRLIVSRLAEDVERLSPLMRFAVEKCGPAKNHTPKEIRNKFYNAILHDLIINFIHERIEGGLMEEISSDYEKFRMDINKVRNMEAFAEAQNWTRIAAKLFMTPPSQTWKNLALALMRNIDEQLWQISGTMPGAKRRNIIRHETGKLHLPAIIKTAFELSMEMRSGILSQRLKLTVGANGSRMDPSEVEIGEDLAQKTSDQPGLGCRDYYILGSRSFGLTADFNDGSRNFYLKPIVDYN